MWVLTIYRKYPFILPLGLLLLGLLSFSNAVPNPFVHDDIVFIEQNPDIGRLSLSSIFQYASPHASQTSLINKYYRPFAELLYRLEYAFFGMRPQWFHLTNVLFHILNSWFIFKVLHRITRHDLISVMAAFIFLIHPVQTEPVACASSISNVISTLCALSSFYLYLRIVEEPAGKTSPWSYLGSLVLFFVSMLVKEQTIAFIILVAIYHLFFRGHERLTPRASFIVLGGYALMTVSYLYFRRMMVGTSVLSMINFDQEFWLRMMALPRTLLMYMRIVIAPYDLHYYRSLDVLASNTSSYMIFLVCVIFIGVVISRLPQEDRRFACLGMIWFIVLLGPMLNIVPLINEYSFILTADHFLYVPMVGLVLAVLYILKALFERYAVPLKISLLMFLIVCACYVTLTLSVSRSWAGEIPLFERTRQYQPQLGRIRILLARAYYFNEQYEQAVFEGAEALRIMREYMRVTEGRPAQAIYRGFVKGIHFDLAHSYEGFGDRQEVVRQYKSALLIDPNDAVLHNNIAVAFVNLGDIKQAKEHFIKALTLDPQNHLARANLEQLN